MCLIYVLTLCSLFVRTMRLSSSTGFASHMTDDASVLVRLFPPTLTFRLCLTPPTSPHPFAQPVRLILGDRFPQDSIPIHAHRPRTRYPIAAPPSPAHFFSDGTYLLAIQKRNLDRLKSSSIHSVRVKTADKQSQILRNILPAKDLCVLLVILCPQILIKICETADIHA